MRLVARAVPLVLGLLLVQDFLLIFGDEAFCSFDVVAGDGVLLQTIGKTRLQIVHVDVGRLLER